MIFFRLLPERVRINSYHSTDLSSPCPLPPFLNFITFTLQHNQNSHFVPSFLHHFFNTTRPHFDSFKHSTFDPHSTQTPLQVSIDFKLTVRSCTLLHRSELPNSHTSSSHHITSPTSHLVTLSSPPLHIIPCTAEHFLFWSWTQDLKNNQ